MNELRDAWLYLTSAQAKLVHDEHARGLSISGIACKLGLTRSYVHSYIRHLNQQ